jgi:predicted acylesterase/phospholipase RssA
MKLYKEHSDIAKNLQLISSVSGGSLASAAYVALLSKHYNSESFEIDEEKFVKKMEIDFLCPAILGAIFPWTDRGEAIEKYWDKNIGLGGIDLEKISKKWKQAIKNKNLNISNSEYPPFPIPLFNCAMLQGHSVIISPLEKNAYICEKLHSEALSSENKYEKYGNLKPSWVYYRTGVYGLEDLVDQFIPSLSDAVRASANFPFGFPLVQLNLNTEKNINNTNKNNNKVPMFSPDRKNNKVKLTDGGTLSNSGIWPLYQMFINELPDLRSRGVLLIVVEASKMPAYKRNPNRWIQSLYGIIDDKAPKSQKLHHLIYEFLFKQLNGRFEVIQIDLEPYEKYNIMTTWNLDKNKICDLKNTFHKQWNKASPIIREKWIRLSQNEDIATSKKTSTDHNDWPYEFDWWWRAPMD